MFLEVHGDLTDDDEYGMECEGGSSDYDTDNIAKQSNGLTKQIIEFQSRHIITNNGGENIEYDRENIAKQSPALAERIREF